MISPDFAEEMRRLEDRVLFELGVDALLLELHDLAVLRSSVEAHPRHRGTFAAVIAGAERREREIHDLLDMVADMEERT